MELIFGVVKTNWRVFWFMIMSQVFEDGVYNVNGRFQKRKSFI